MKFFSLFASFLLLVCSPLQANPLHPPGHAKITKNEAEHIALKSFPGARVTAAKLETVQGQLLWSLQLVEPGKSEARSVAVDAVSGHIVPPAGQKP
ncbi:MAG: PepSY domain-containing protein [Chthoniobacterales bacterium]|nr:PepSY domain-containing protein [Chthoniobacterales bacterium]